MLPFTAIGCLRSIQQSRLCTPSVLKCSALTDARHVVDQQTTCCVPFFKDWFWVDDVLSATSWFHPRNNGALTTRYPHITVSPPITCNSWAAIVRACAIGTKNIKFMNHKGFHCVVFQLWLSWLQLFQRHNRLYFDASIILSNCFEIVNAFISAGKPVLVHMTARILFVATGRFAIQIVKHSNTGCHGILSGS